MDGLNHSYESRTILGMELLVLRALDWRLNCVTPHTYVDMMAWRIRHLLPPDVAGALRARVNDRLLCMLSDAEFLVYRPFVLAVTALKLGMEEVCPEKVDSALGSLHYLIPAGAASEMDKCAERSKEMSTVASKWNLCYLPSPVSVMRRPRRRLEMPHDHLDLDHYFGGKAASAGSQEYCKRQKR